MPTRKHLEVMIKTLCAAHYARGIVDGERGVPVPPSTLTDAKTAEIALSSMLDQLYGKKI